MILTCFFLPFLSIPYKIILCEKNICTLRAVSCYNVFVVNSTIGDAETLQLFTIHTGEKKEELFVKPVRIVIAQNDPQELQELQKTLSGFHELEIVGITTNSEEAFQLVHDLMPQLLLCESKLSGMDGLSLVETLHVLPDEQRPQVILMGDMNRTEVLVKAMTKGAADYITKPLDIDALLKIIHRLVGEVPPQTPDHVPSMPSASLEEYFSRQTTETLLYLNIPPHLIGYRYLQKAVVITIGEPNLSSKAMRDLYEKVAEAFHTSPSNVERDIRNAINSAWNRGGDIVYSRLFCASSEIPMRPSNCELISMLAEHIRSGDLKLN